MSRSKRKSYIKERPRNKKKSSLYWRRVRRILNQIINKNPEIIKDPKEIVNDYDYSDYKFYSKDIKDKRK